MNRLLILYILLSPAFQLNAQRTTLNGKIKIYFTRPVDTSFSKGIYAEQPYKAIDDTLVAYINRAKYTMDIAIYNYTYASTIADIAGAINNAYNRGVKVRIIYDGSVGNTGLNNISSSIPKVASPQGSNYNIMHNKFVVIDSRSVDPDDAIVWTGSANWSNNMFYLDANNVVIIQDQPLASAYRTEFEEMWGDTGITPNVAKSKFGKYKTDNTPHQFVIDGKVVELYFSPSDDANAKVVNAINSSNSDLEFCMLQFTRSDVSTAVITKAQLPGFIAMGIEDPSGLLAGQTIYDNMKAVMGNNLLTDKQSNSLLHHKYLIVDQSNVMSDPLVLTGSHNWTTSANTTNDENTLIIHDSTIANVYYQEFIARFKENGGVLSVDELADDNDIIVYPNPASGRVNVEMNFNATSKITVEVDDVLGRKVFSNTIGGKQTNLDIFGYSSGIYFVRIITSNNTVTKKLVVN
jgi:phosphatidylserine/phosphatidylglycerophosphate/cardiolipin synthase-like enzyme